MKTNCKYIEKLNKMKIVEDDRNMLDDCCFISKLGFYHILKSLSFSRMAQEFGMHVNT